jgi:hypothetical protein
MNWKGYHGLIYGTNHAVFSEGTEENYENIVMMVSQGRFPSEEEQKNNWHVDDHHGHHNHYHHPMFH